MLKEDAVTMLIAAIQARTEDPRLMLLDTLARNFGAGDENSTKDMGRFVAACDRLRVAFPKAIVLVVHHCRWDRLHERGSAALRGAIDTLLGVAPKDGRIALTVEKQKDFQREKSPLWLELQDVPHTQSAVLALAEPPRKKGNANEETAMEALIPAIHGLTTSAWQEASGINANTSKDVRARLKNKGRVEARNGTWFALP